MTPYQQLKKVIQEANPEIMELKFGCQIDPRGAKEKVKVLQYVGFSNRQHAIRASLSDGEALLLVDKVSQEEVLGRPIRLADVLLALKDKYLAEAITESRYSDFVTYWNLRNDDLDNQSEETKQFLIDLLVTQK